MESIKIETEDVAVEEEPWTREETLEQLDAVMERLYQDTRLLSPMYPWVLVLVLKKQQVRKSGIELPDHQQNKPMHEGIVLASWRSKTIEVGRIEEDGRMLTRTKVLHSQLSAGDHVLFHHWAGQPIHGFDDQRFRMVRECDWHETQQGGIVGTIGYAHEMDDPLEQLAGEIVDNNTTDWPLLKAKLKSRFVVVDHEQGGVTLSGA